ncbi:hypothetical protein FDA94_26715 [Herbidospora galbida]|uniref:Uncharacterized protein n=1 Tax=Herbidospora galbida TaxID=2575442 RepID=A0A4U3MA95_9ACTN|nr:hypothetical protein [Herbidospora galbida]TKK85262.1 hypothetical protein FDA94_26715 [Herbidospora galbida]
MSLFSSQFDRARRLSATYAGEPGETRFWTPATVGVAAGLGAAALVAADPDQTAAFGGDGDSGGNSGDDGPWSVHSDWSDASIGGDGDFMYFSDGDVSFTVG